MHNLRCEWDMLEQSGVLQNRLVQFHWDTATGSTGIGNCPIKGCRLVRAKLVDLQATLWPLRMLAFDAPLHYGRA